MIRLFCIIFRQMIHDHSTIQLLLILGLVYLFAYAIETWAQIGKQ